MRLMGLSLVVDIYGHKVLEQTGQTFWPDDNAKTKGKSVITIQLILRKI